ncbi:hypothetical protein F5B19DRAFT_480146 [Rostrohypoxylon terebratum]|nr:hypothetical protein F5B19DRAFT_480146 [Rostrohypoxylon terebratum]
MMASVIGLRTTHKYTGDEIEVDLSPLNHHKTVVAPASNLLEDVDMGTPDPFPQVDRDIRLITAACMASDPKERPSLAELEGWVAERLLYGANKYGNVVFERDDNVRSIVRILIFEAF